MIDFDLLSAIFDEGRIPKGTSLRITTSNYMFSQEVGNGKRVISVSSIHGKSVPTSTFNNKTKENKNG